MRGLGGQDGRVMKVNEGNPPVYSPTSCRARQVQTACHIRPDSGALPVLRWHEAEKGGFTLVLHIWNRCLGFHPCLHGISFAATPYLGMMCALTRGAGTFAFTFP